MTILRMDTEQAENLVNNIRQTTEGIETELGLLRNHMNAIGGYWQGPASQQFAELLANLATRMETAKENGLTLGQRLTAEIAQWQETAAQLDGGVVTGGMFAKELVPVSAAAGEMGQTGTIWNKLGAGTDMLEDGLTAYAGGAIIGSLALKDGKVIVKGKEMFRDLAGVSQTLGRINPENILKHIRGQQLANLTDVSKLSAGFIALGYGFDVADSWEQHAAEYANYSTTKQIAAQSTDAILQLVPTGLGVVGGVALGVGLATLVAPLAGITLGTVAVGGAIVLGASVVGSIVGGQIGDTIGDKVVEKLTELGVRDAAIDAGDKTINFVDQHIAQPVVNLIQNANAGINDWLSDLKSSVKQPQLAF